MVLHRADWVGVGVVGIVDWAHRMSLLLTSFERRERCVVDILNRPSSVGGSNGDGDGFASNDPNITPGSVVKRGMLVNRDKIRLNCANVSYSNVATTGGKAAPAKARR